MHPCREEQKQEGLGLNKQEGLGLNTILQPSEGLLGALIPFDCELGMGAHREATSFIPHINSKSSALCL